jgi:hypothetical protein
VARRKLGRAQPSHLSSTASRWAPTRFAPSVTPVAGAKQIEKAYLARSNAWAHVTQRICSPAVLWSPEFGLMRAYIAPPHMHSPLSQAHAHKNSAAQQTVPSKNGQMYHVSVLCVMRTYDHLLFSLFHGRFNRLSSVLEAEIPPCTGTYMVKCTGT